MCSSWLWWTLLWLWHPSFEGDPACGTFRLYILIFFISGCALPAWDPLRKRLYPALTVAGTFASFVLNRELVEVINKNVGFSRRPSSNQVMKEVSACSQS